MQTIRTPGRVLGLFAVVAVATGLSSGMAQEAPAPEAVLQEAPVMADDPGVMAPEPAAEPAAAMPESAPVEAAPVDEMPARAGSVARAQFTTAVVEREPTDALDVVGTDLSKVYFFTELMDLEGRTVTHRWSHEGALAAEVSFAVGGPRWRVHSSKNLMPDWTGSWTVYVVDDAGRVLDSRQFEYRAGP
jgi:hypothetical protein